MVTRVGLPTFVEHGSTGSTRSRRQVSTTTTMEAVRVRIHITEGQRLALHSVLDRSPNERVRTDAFSVSFDMDDPIAWLETRMAEWPRGSFPRARLHAVLRKLSAAIQGQAEPDLPTSQVRPDLGTPDSRETKS